MSPLQLSIVCICDSFLVVKISFIFYRGIERSKGLVSKDE